MCARVQQEHVWPSSYAFLPLLTQALGGGSDGSGNWVPGTQRTRSGLHAQLPWGLGKASVGIWEVSQRVAACLSLYPLLPWRAWALEPDWET